MIEDTEIRFIPDRLNEEPVVFLSMTNSEFKVVLVVLLVTLTPLSIILGAVGGGLLVGTAKWGVLGMAVGPALTFAALYFIGKKLKVVKRGKPKQYHVVLINGWLEDRGLKPKSMIRQSMVWDIRRTRKR